MCLKDACPEHQEDINGEGTYSFPISKKENQGEARVQITYLTYSGPNWRHHGPGAPWVKLLCVLTNRKAPGRFYFISGYPRSFKCLLQIKQKSHNKCKRSGKHVKEKPLSGGTCLNTERNIST